MQKDRRTFKCEPQLRKRSTSINTEVLKSDMSAGQNVLYLLSKFQSSSDTLDTGSTPGAI